MKAPNFVPLLQTPVSRSISSEYSDERICPCGVGKLPGASLHHYLARFISVQYHSLLPQHRLSKECPERNSYLFGDVIPTSYNN